MYATRTYFYMRDVLGLCLGTDIYIMSAYFFLVFSNFSSRLLPFFKVFYKLFAKNAIQEIYD